MDDERDAAFLAVWVDAPPELKLYRAYFKDVWDLAWLARQGEVDLLTSQVATVRSIYQGWLSEAKAIIRQLEAEQETVTSVDTVAELTHGLAG